MSPTDRARSIMRLVKGHRLSDAEMLSAIERAMADDRWLARSEVLEVVERECGPISRANIASILDHRSAPPALGAPEFSERRGAKPFTCSAPKSSDS